MENHILGQDQSHQPKKRNETHSTNLLHVAIDRIKIWFHFSFTKQYIHPAGTWKGTYKVSKVHIKYTEVYKEKRHRQY